MEVILLRVKVEHIVHDDVELAEASPRSPPGVVWTFESRPLRLIRELSESCVKATMASFLCR